MTFKWRRGDYIRLGKAVAQFNKEINKNRTIENELFLPQELSYRELKQDIQTREGLEAYIEGLKRIKLPGSFSLEKLEGGEIITAYEKRELERGRVKAISSVESELSRMIAQEKTNWGIKADIDLPPAHKTREIKELEGKLTDYKNLFSLTGKDFKALSRKLGISQTEINYRHSYVFRENYMKVMERYKNFRDYWIFKNWANRHKNPVDFYNSLPEGVFQPDDLYYQSDHVYSEEDFASFLEDFGINIDKEYEKRAKRMGISVDELKDRIDKQIKERQEKE